MKETNLNKKKHTNLNKKKKLSGFFTYWFKELTTKLYYLEKTPGIKFV